MNASFHHWLAQCVSMPGMVACGLRPPDEKPVCHSAEPGCPPEVMERILDQFENMRAAGFTEDLAPRWATWTFDQGRIRFVERPDGWLLGVVVRPESGAAQSLDLLSLEFLSLPSNG
jgi:hypothetical protein